MISSCRWQDGREAVDTKQTTADMTVFVSFLENVDFSLDAFQASFLDINVGWSYWGGDCSHFSSVSLF